MDEKYCVGHEGIDAMTDSQFASAVKIYLSALSDGHAEEAWKIAARTGYSLPSIFIDNKVWVICVTINATHKNINTTPASDPGFFSVWYDRMTPAAAMNFIEEREKRDNVSQLRHTVMNEEDVSVHIIAITKGGRDLVFAPKRLEHGAYEFDNILSIIEDEIDQDCHHEDGRNRCLATFSDYIKDGLIDPEAILEIAERWNQGDDGFEEIRRLFRSAGVEDFPPYMSGRDISKDGKTSGGDVNCDGCPHDGDCDEQRLLSKGASKAGTEPGSVIPFPGGEKQNGIQGDVDEEDGRDPISKLLGDDVFEHVPCLHLCKDRKLAFIAIPDNHYMNTLNNVQAMALGRYTSTLIMWCNKYAYDYEIKNVDFEKLGCPIEDDLFKEFNNLTVDDIAAPNW